MRSGGVGAARHRGGPGLTPRGGGVSPIRSADRPRQPLWGEDRGGVEAAVVAGTLPGGRAGPPSSGFSRDGRGRHVTRRGACVAVGGSARGRGVAPQLGAAHPRGPPQNIPIRASKGMTCPNLREIGSGRGRGFSPVDFPTTLLLV